MKLLAKSAALALVVASFPNCAFAALVTENFNTNTDTYWEHVNNRDNYAGRNYGWSTTDNTGTSVTPPAGGSATGAGELGGIMVRGDSEPVEDPSVVIPNYYAFNIGDLTMDEPFQASGLIRFPASSTVFYFGFFQGADSVDQPAVQSFVGVAFAGLDTFAEVRYFEGSGQETQATVGSFTAGATEQFGISYDPLGNGGEGTLAITRNGNTYVHQLDPGGGKEAVLETAADRLTHFGIFPAIPEGGAATEFYIDDLTFTSDNPIPEPSAFALAAIGGLLAMRRPRRANACKG